MSSSIPRFTNIGISLPTARDSIKTPFSITRYPITWVIILFRVTIMYNPVNSVERDTTKYILLILESAIALDKIKVAIMIRVMIISDMKFGKKGSASRVILFLFIT